MERGSCELSGNELAKEQAKLGSAQPQTDGGLDRAVQRAILSSHNYVPSHSHLRLTLLQSSKLEERSRPCRPHTLPVWSPPSLSKVATPDGAERKRPVQALWRGKKKAEHLWLQCAALMSERYRRQLGFSFGEL